MLLRKITAFIRSCSERDNSEAYEIVTCLVKQVAIVINLLFIEKPIARLNLIIKKSSRDLKL